MMSNLLPWDAVRRGDLETVRRFVLNEGLDVNAVDDIGRSLLHVAAWYNHDEIVQFLLDNGSLVDPRQNFGAYTPLMNFSRRNPDVQVIARLLQSGADVHARDRNGWTPLHFACYFGINSDAVSMMIAYGADVHARSNSGNTPLHFATEKEKNGLESMHALLKHGADIMARDKAGQSPLHKVAKWGDARSTQLLLQENADIHAVDNDGNTALHLAMENENEQEIVPILLSFGARVFVCNKKLETPLHSAIRERVHVQIIASLLDHSSKVLGANLESLLMMPDKEGYIAFHHSKNVESAQVLLEHSLVDGEIQPWCYSQLQARDDRGRTLLQITCDESLVSYLKSFQDNPLAVSNLNYGNERSPAVIINPKLCKFQFAIAEDFCKTLDITWEATDQCHCGHASVGHLNLPDDIVFAIMGYLATSDVIQRRDTSAHDGFSQDSSVL